MNSRTVNSAQSTSHSKNGTGRFGTESVFELVFYDVNLGTVSQLQHFNGEVKEH